MKILSNLLDRYETPIEQPTDVDVNEIIRSIAESS
jgi:hypothetical protein